MIGYAFCGSFCTLHAALIGLEALLSRGLEVQPIMSERVYRSDTRFFKAEDLKKRVIELTGREIIHTVEAAEPLGASNPLDALVVAPCTGNTLAKFANGITDGAVNMAIKAHLRCDRPTLFCVATNDAISQNLSSIAYALTRRSVYLLPMYQDSPKGKPYSLVANFELIEEGYLAMMRGEQLRPLFLY